MPSPATTVDSDEVAKFERMARDWWDPDGDFRPLHRMNPCRLDYVTRQIAGEFGRDLSSSRPFAGLEVLDIGSGGGLMAEPLARLGAAVTGADAAPTNIEVAAAHARLTGLKIDYRHTTAEALAETGATFDVVQALEIIEHVADPAAFLAALRRLIRPGGLLLLSTLNRTAKARALAIVGAEYILRWVPKGTHDWAKFITPDELSGLMSGAGFTPVDRQGMVYNPLTGDWALSDRDLSVNYIAAARPAA
ncbi:bifunctional 2-polyprenyl-6-hydroxyphenol methylase/3-demethylubiquinol 3-O-methyltransferase UbiG [Ovoidimarina sediminis]|uniref:bifunctional 2-polyprenyl-6-hydroxyphenol methylase/3-demethylubiquinol 3-O-methyltransferase UbiG n=1 Tax=Ovoidimarina sediminis TaxID=3079856 RepID=UPI0029063879|nr:bifunctional 2-polyprenyl-6-hydroxyphenol methylase/3-demethylubiquinol 3-O-methyltransferase UbiG [Rhodophyticola sp. MJ-SS7]MDU8942423.1 bifunctional 2-polyprenyl-6-hydroxyphenol methylase/3-demethylubiquinol 3-O-methyltransferase UbiG [Rhodophyticola sp. MJ-SS7]